ncbi:cytochrome P450 [Mycena floridula]|nr:cytochrome P450 [Mycena floridula]
MISTTVITGLLCLAALYILQTFREFRALSASLRNVSGYVSLFSDSSPVAAFFPRASRFALGAFNFFKNKHRVYDKAGWDIHPAISLCPGVQAAFCLSDATTIKEVCSNRVAFPKPIWRYEVLAIFGSNIVASEGEDWKKFRRISSPAFSERNNQLVWDAATEIISDLFDESQSQISFDNVLDLTLSIALHIIGVAGFGRDMSAGNEIPPGHQLSFKSCIKMVSEDLFLGILVPNWCPNFTSRLTRIRLAFKELRVFVHEMIQSRQTSNREEDTHDLFSNLLDANADEGDILTESELMGNIFIFVLAGHETTAHTLCYALALLALFPDEQEKLYQHCKDIIPDDQVPTYQDSSLLKQSLAVWNETLRMFPPVVIIPKEAAEDTTLSTTNDDGQTMTFPVPRGTQLDIHTVGLHYNPRYWKDPETFEPDRFMRPWNRDAFLPYSGGVRSCLGRKFAETEGIACLTLLTLKYKITVTEELRFAGESFETKKARVLDSMAGVTLTPKRVPLTFTKRV